MFQCYVVVTPLCITGVCQKLPQRDNSCDLLSSLLRQIQVGNSIEIRHFRLSFICIKLNQVLFLVFFSVIIFLTHNSFYYYLYACILVWFAPRLMSQIEKEREKDRKRKRERVRGIAETERTR